MGVKKSRSFARKERGVERRKRKSIMLIVAEGKNNKSEKNYFPSFNSRNGKYNVVVKTPGDTDPEGMLNALNKRWRDDELSVENSDLAFVVLDLDCDEKKAEKIRQLNGQADAKKFVVSNPCIEVWFLNHYVYSTREYENSNAVIAALKEYVPGYEKHNNMYPILISKLQDAIKHERQLEKYHSGKKWPSNDCNPRTDIADLILRIIEET